MHLMLVFVPFAGDCTTSGISAVAQCHFQSTLNITSIKCDVKFSVNITMCTCYFYLYRDHILPVFDMP